MRPEWYRVQRVGRETADTFTLEMAPAAGGDRLAYAPGQFTMLYAFGVGEVAISISGDAAKRNRLVQTIRKVGTVTHALSGLKAGDLVGVRGPYGNQWPMEAAEGHDVVLIPGGIGLAPLRPALYHILSHRDRYNRVALLYGARSPQELLYRREVQRWRSHLDVEVQVTVDRASGDWHGNVGVVTTLIPRAGFDPARAIAMVCGPEVMMRFTALELQKRGIDPHNIYVSMERNMKCAIGFCGHCQFGPVFICRDGPVFAYTQVRELLDRREV
jgi:NAD(P)H-flavin reductase